MATAYIKFIHLSDSISIYVFVDDHFCENDLSLKLTREILEIVMINLHRMYRTLYICITILLSCIAIVL